MRDAGGVAARRRLALNSAHSPLLQPPLARLEAACPAACPTARFGGAAARRPGARYSLYARARAVGFLAGRGERSRARWAAVGGGGQPATRGAGRAPVNSP